jgi:hypothetical protein
VTRATAEGGLFEMPCRYDNTGESYVTKPTSVAIEEPTFAMRESLCPTPLAFAHDICVLEYQLALTHEVAPKTRLGVESLDKRFDPRTVRYEPPLMAMFETVVRLETIGAS